MYKSLLLQIYPLYDSHARSTGKKQLAAAAALLPLQMYFLYESHARPTGKMPTSLGNIFIACTDIPPAATHLDMT
jgi:hypothetical protein